MKKTKNKKKTSSKKRYIKKDAPKTWNPSQAEIESAWDSGPVTEEYVEEVNSDPVTNPFGYVVEPNTVMGEFHKDELAFPQERVTLSDGSLFNKEQWAKRLAPKPLFAFTDKQLKIAIFVATVAALVGVLVVSHG